MRKQTLQAAPNGVYEALNVAGRGTIQCCSLIANIPSGVKGYAKGCLLHALDASTEATSLYINTGTFDSCTFTAWDLNLAEAALLTGLTASAADLNILDAQTLTTPAGAGATGGTGTVYTNSVFNNGTMYYTRLFIDLTGLGSSTTDGDIIGTGTANAHIGQVTAAQQGTIDCLRMTCLEVPATGADDIDLFYATVATGKFDDAISGITGQTSLISAGGAWTANLGNFAGAAIPANAYLYLVNGEGSVPGTYTAGQFLIEIWGH